MSELHSETYDRSLRLTVRVKLVNLNHSGAIVKSPSKPASVERISQECLSAIAGTKAEPAKAETLSLPFPATPVRPRRRDNPNVEICMFSGARIPVVEFESHIECCSICANRVELQLDFMEALEVAVYNRGSESEKIRGAMLVSTPKMNFAVCGEIEVG